MRTIQLTTWVSAALLIAGTAAIAQTAPTSGHGNDLSTTPQQPTVNPNSAPASSGQNKDSGNDMVSSPNQNANQSGMSQSGGKHHPDFSTLDTQNKGTLSKADAKGHPWLSKHFAKCDTDHDGTLSREEYEACGQH